jgi:hypothetical protein
MKEDILEQIIEDYYVGEEGWFVKHNLKYRPMLSASGHISNKDSVHSDIDILAFNAKSRGIDKVHVISCKSWQGGFKLSHWLPLLEGNAKRTNDWKKFRELVEDKWTDAFLKAIEDETGSKDFTYVIAVTKLKGTEADITAFEQCQKVISYFEKRNVKIKIEFRTLEELIKNLLERQEKKETNAPEATDFGRTLQLIKAAGLEIKMSENTKRRK